MNRFALSIGQLNKWYDHTYSCVEARRFGFSVLWPGLQLTSAVGGLCMTRVINFPEFLEILVTVWQQPVCL